MPCHSKWQFKSRLDRWLVPTTWGVIPLFNFVWRKNVHMVSLKRHQTFTAGLLFWLHWYYLYPKKTEWKLGTISELVTFISNNGVFLPDQIKKFKNCTGNVTSLELSVTIHIWLTCPIPTRHVHFKFTKIITWFEMSVAPLLSVEVIENWYDSRDILFDIGYIGSRLHTTSNHIASDLNVSDGVSCFVEIKFFHAY